MTAQQARDALLAAQDPTNPQPLTPLLWPAGKRATRNERILSLLGDLRQPSYRWAQWHREFQAAGLASALPGLTNAGDIYQPEPGVDSWRISTGAALRFTELTRLPLLQEALLLACQSRNAHDAVVGFPRLNQAAEMVNPNANHALC